MAESEVAESAETTPSADSPRLVRRGWNPPIGGFWGWLTARRMRRLAITAVGLGLFIWFAWLVWTPFRHPRVQVVALSAGDYQGLRAPPLAFSAEDIAALSGLSNLFDEHLGRAEPYLWDSLADPAKLQSLGARLRGITESSSDTIILFVGAHGQLEDGEPYLLCRNFDPGNPKAGRMSVRDFLDQVRACRAGRKVLILDVGRIEDDPRIGYVRNDLATRIAEEVRDSGDDTLFLLMAHGDFERSQVTPAIDRSVFGYALEWGLAGAADSNGDRMISLSELHRYTSATVSDWVAYVSNAADQQHPLLAWGGQDEEGAPSPYRAATEVILAPIAAGFNREEIPPLADQVKLSRKTSRGEAWHLMLSGDSAPTRAAATPTPSSAASSSKENALTSSLSRIRIGDVRSAGQLRAQAESETRQAGRDVAEKVIEAPSSASPPADAPVPADTGAATPAVETAQAPATSEATTSNAATSPAAAEAPAASAPAAATPNASATAAARVAIPKLFAEAWRLRDQIAALSPAMRPRGYAAQFWRELQQSILDNELQYRAGKIGSQTRIKAALERIIAGEKLLVESATQPELQPTESGPARLLRFRPWAAQRVTDPHSAAMERLVTRQSGRTLPLAAKSVLDANAAADDPKAFRAAWSALPAESQSFAETRAALSLAATSEKNWSVARQAWRATLASETLAAADPWIVPWAAADLDAADAHRWEAERELQEAIGADHAAKAAQLLDQAMTRYQTVAEHLDVVANARAMREELLERAPDYLRLHAIRPRVTADAFADFCEQLGTLSDLLASPDAARIAELRETTERLSALQKTLEAPLAPANITELTNVPAQTGDPRRVTALLDTPLLPADPRLKLLSIVARLDGRLIADIKPITGAGYQLPLADPIADADASVVVARWHHALAQLAGLNAVDGDNSEAKIADAFYRLQDARAKMTMTYPDTIDEFARRFDAFETLLSDFYAALPRRIADAAQANQDLTDPSTRAERVIALRRIDRALRVVDARDARRTGDVPVAALIDAAAWHELLFWHADRATRAASDSPGDLAGFWSDAATSYRAQAAEVFQDDAPQRSSSPDLALAGPESLDLSVQPEQDASFTLTHRGSSPADVWLTLRYDPEIVNVVAGGPHAWYREQDLDSSGTSSAVARDEALFARAASLRMNPGQQVTLRLQAQSRARASQPARVVIRALARDASARRTLSVKLPTTDTVDLAVDGTPGTWTLQDGRLLLSPFPNRENRYQWSLVNAFGAAKEVKAELFALSRPLTARAPAGSLSAAEVAEFLENVGALTPLAAAEKVALPAGGAATPIPFPPPPADAPPPAEGAAPPPLPRFDHGALLLVTELANGRVSVHPIVVAPQRPRRFVRPRVRYNAVTERVEITVTADDPAAMPEKPVRVACQVAEPLPPGTQARLSDELSAPNYTASMWIAAPLDPARVLTLTLSVDDYPRAFTFRVPCQETGRDVPPADDLLAARISAPAAGAAFRAPAGSIDVVAEIDLPRGAEDDPGTLIEVGIDADRDRDFRGESTVRLSSDRQVRNELLQALPGGVVVIQPKVGDYQLAITPPGLVNNRVGVLARVIWNDRAAWSQEREIILDGTPPTIERVRVKPAGNVAIGDPIEVSCLALDGDLSGVASVEMTIDQLGTAEFEGNLPPTPAKLGADRRWSAKLDTAPLGAGTFHILVRAKDQVGNESDVNSSATVRLMTAEAIADARRRATNRVVGTLHYGNAGFAGISVRLEALPGDPATATPALPPPEPIAPVATNDLGAFTFDRVPPGKYKLTAEGVVRNKMRRAEAEVTVDPAPTAIRPLQLELR